MEREDLGDLNAFMAVAEERSFTRAAAKLGTSQSALSHTIRRLETRLMNIKQNNVPYCAIFTTQWRTYLMSGRMVECPRGRRSGCRCKAHMTAGSRS
jgi:hypothetical protein